ncbi:MAG: CDP-diacylglycerol--glycerol-3-phosphate 3-phosphatidyltransferase [Proteobacteria bacterium]|nr:MAG: CDP-diacylglycerol--glycerol-3-phosphate 3-phosphatidyltransferase [Pseudomonadota bacterium]
MLFNIPIFLTYLRIAAIPLMVALFYMGYPLLTATVFMLAGFTDWVDGFLARRWGQESRFGAFLDPIADKLMVAVALVLIVEDQVNPWVTIAVAIIISRELLISALREWMAEIGQRSKVAVAFTGKLKTTAQMVAITMLLYDKPLLGVPLHEIGLVLLVVATVLTVWSMMQYLRDALSSNLAD